MWIAPLALLAMALFVALGGWLVTLLWNWLLPPLFGWRTIGFWQAVGLLALCRILFGSLGIRPSPRPRMTPEERARFRERMAERWGFGRPSEGGQTP